MTHTKQVKTVGFWSLLLLGSSLLLSANCFAVGKVSTEMNTGKKYGANVGLGDPFPGLLGLNVGYNLNKDIRITAGYAEVEVTSSITITNSGVVSKTDKAQTYALGGQYLFTDWGFRPTVGLHAGYFSITGEGDFEVNGFDESTAYGYSNVGFDWISQSGYHLATGINVALLGGTGAGAYANFGYFF